MKLVSITLAMLFATHTAFAQATSPQPPDDRSALQQIFNTAASNLADIQRLLDSRDYQSALSKAKTSLDDVRIKSGIHPKASYREKISVPQGSLKESFRSVGLTKKDLDIDAQDAISLAVANHRAGYFLDILNLMKRTNLLYLEALQGELQSHGRLLAEDVEKIRHDIQDVQAIPLYLKDASVGAYFLVFDYEVANNDQAYLFNRELKTYLLGQGRALGIRNEKQIDELLNQHVQDVRADYVRGSSGNGSAVASSGGSSAAASLANGQIFDSPNFSKCVDLYAVYSSDIPGATDKCLKLVPSYNFLKPNFSKCVNLYAVYKSDIPRATDKCRELM